MNQLNDLRTLLWQWWSGYVFLDIMGRSFYFGDAQHLRINETCCEIFIPVENVDRLLYWKEFYRLVELFLSLRTELILFQPPSMNIKFDKKKKMFNKVSWGYFNDPAT